MQVVWNVFLAQNAFCLNDLGNEKVQMEKVGDDEYWLPKNLFFRVQRQKFGENHLQLNKNV